VFPQNPSCDLFGCPSNGPCGSWGCPGQGSGPNPASGGGGGAGGGGGGGASSSGSLGQTGTSNSDDYADPSGIVQSTTGVPLSGTKVVLSRSKHRSGRFRVVPNGSTIMSPANRRNPDHTDTDGSFGWDVLSGFYRIAASHSGCTTASTKALKVPPPALDLVIALHCARLHRARTTIEVKLLRTKGSKAVIAVATVTAHGHGAPIGVVTFTPGKKKLGSVALNPTTHAASEVAVLPAAGARVRAIYSGDAAYGPSKSA
jgi:Bacterial Ig-like domain (group 3)